MITIKIEWSYIPIVSTSSLLLESAVDDRFNVSDGIKSVVRATIVHEDVDEGFGSWSSVFCFFNSDDEKKDVIFLIFGWFDVMNLSISL